MPLILPNTCKAVTFKRVRVKIEGCRKKDIKTLFRMKRDMDLIRFQDLKVDDFPKFMKLALPKKYDIKTLVIELSDRGANTEIYDLSQILLNIRLGKVKEIFINSIHIT